MTTAPAISVVIPMHNRRDTIERAIGSVLAQDFANFEIIVVDDTSTDGGAVLVEAIEDPRVRLLRQPAQAGANAARNRGILEAKASLIAFLDSDDAFLSHKLSSVASVFETRPELGTLVDSFAIVSPFRGEDTAELLVNRRIESSDAFLDALFSSTDKRRRLRKATSGITVRRSVAVAAGLFDESVKRRQDMEFLARLAKCAPCAVTGRVLWTKYEQSESISFTGSGFVDATLLMHRLHPEYGSSPSRMAGDIVMYLWESLSRRRLSQVARDLGVLRRTFGIPATVSTLAAGCWAWYRDPRRKR